MNRQTLSLVLKDHVWIDENPSGRFHLWNGTNEQTFKTVDRLLQALHAHQALDAVRHDRMLNAHLKGQKHDIQALKRYLGGEIADHLQALITRKRKRPSYLTKDVEEETQTQTPSASASKKPARTRKTLPSAIASKQPVHTRKTLPSAIASKKPAHTRKTLRSKPTKTPNPLHDLYHNLFDILSPTNDTLSKIKKNTNLKSILPQQQKQTLWKQDVPDRFFTVKKKKEKDGDVIIVHINSRTQPRLINYQCLQFKIITTPTEKTLYVDLIFWFTNREQCFGQKLRIDQILAFMKKISRVAGCEIIRLDDQSYFPLQGLTQKDITDFNKSKPPKRHPPFLKVLYTLCYGETMYMRYGFVYLPKKFLKEVYSYFRSCGDKDTRDIILHNLSLITHLHTHTILTCAQQLSLSDTSSSSPSSSPSSSGQTLSGLACAIVQGFKTVKTPAEIDYWWDEYDKLSHATFGDENLWIIMGDKTKMDDLFQWFVSFVCSRVQGNISPTLDDLVNVVCTERLVPKTVSPARDKTRMLETLRHLLWCMASGFSSAEMFWNESTHSWSHFTR